MSCGETMKRDIYIAPLGRSDGMVVYICPTCGKMDTKLVPAPAPRIGT
jgi:hypothetical protein